MLRAVVLVGIGGGVGSILRYLTGVVVNKYVENPFPLATFIVNIVGCFIVGILFGIFERYDFLSVDLRHLFIVGFCGGFTTFSAFALENLTLFQTGNTLVGIVYIATSILIGLLAVWIGAIIVR